MGVGGTDGWGTMDGGLHDWWVMLWSEVAGRDGEVSFGGEFAVGWESMLLVLLGWLFWCRWVVMKGWG